MVMTDDALQKAEQQLEDPDHKLPETSCLDDAGHRLVKLDMLWERELMDKFDFSRHWSPDSSPQGGYNWFVIMEDRRRWPKNLTMEERLQVDAPICCHHMPVTTVGWGSGNLVYKSHSSHHQLALVTGSWQKFCTGRSEVRTLTVDGGLEEDLPSTPCLGPPGTTRESTLTEKCV